MANGWHRADIVAAIHKRGTSLAALARRHGYADSTLRAALSKPARPANAIIAAFIGRPLNELWPAWFDAAGNRLTSRKQRARSPRRSSSQKRGAQLSLTSGGR